MRFVLAAVMCGSVCGCSDYDSAYEKRLADYRVASEFAQLRAEATSLGDGRLELRLPVILVNQLDGTESPQRSTPPFIREFPGFMAAYEGRIDAADGRVPVVLTVGLVPAGDRKEEVAEAILRQVRQDEEFGRATWQKGREIPDVAGGTRKWDVLSLVGSQPFQVEKADVTVEKRLPGTTEVWLSADQKHKACVILAFRAPADGGGSFPLPAISTLTARTVRLAAP